MNKPPLLIDIGPLSCGCTDELMEDMHKALSEDEHDIWLPHESEFIRDLIEKWTAHGMGRFGLLQNELGKWINHAYHQPGIKAAPKPGAFQRWDKSELAMARFYLESVPPEAFTLDDWMMVVDYLVQRYLPQDAIFDEANWNVTRASMMGRIQGQMPDMAAAAVAAMSPKLPDTVVQIEKQFGMTATQKAAIKFSQARTCQYVTNIEDATRAKMKMAIVDWQKDKFEGTPSAMAKRSLEGKLLDEFATLNKDWRRIALTEAGEAANQGVVSATPAGQQLKRVEQYRGACAYCKKIDGAVVTVVEASKKDKNWNTEIWPGKDNHARSASPYKRVGGQLIKREESERWSIPAGLAHPHCRGLWLNLTPPNPKDDPKLAAWLEKVFDKK
jgi:hypothetical protein